MRSCSSHTINLQTDALPALLSGLLVARYAGVRASLTGLQLRQVKDSSTGTGEALTSEDPLSSGPWEALSRAGEAHGASRHVERLGWTGLENGIIRSIWSGPFRATGGLQAGGGHSGTLSLCYRYVYYYVYEYT